MNDQIINKKIEEILNSADGMSKASARPFLFTRLEARMKNEKTLWWKISSLVSKPLVALACIFFVIMINAMVIFFSYRSSGNNASQNGNELAAADEYSQVSTALYDFENTKP